MFKGEISYFVEEKGENGGLRLTAPSHKHWSLNVSVESAGGSLAL